MLDSRIDEIVKEKINLKAARGKILLATKSTESGAGAKRGGERPPPAAAGGGAKGAAKDRPSTAAAAGRRGSGPAGRMDGARPGSPSGVGRDATGATAVRSSKPVADAVPAAAPAAPAARPSPAAMVLAAAGSGAPPPAVCVHSNDHPAPSRKTPCCCDIRSKHWRRGAQGGEAPGWSRRAVSRL
jgi:hypothetical protein